MRDRGCLRGWLLVPTVALALGCGGQVSGDVEPSDDDGIATGGDGGSQSASGGISGGAGGRGGAAINAADAGAGGLVGSGGASGGAAGADAGVGGAMVPDAGPPGGTPTFVAVGYAGRRIRSTDLGKTWTDDQRLGGGGDDQFLLRGIGYGAGRFVAAGWKILSSPDGKTWTEHKNPNNQWLGGVKWGNNRFGAAGGFGYSAYSNDGVTWTAGKSRASEAARSLAFGDGKFMAATDAGNWWSSTDGNTWTRGEGGHNSRITFCGAVFSDASACKTAPGRNEGRTVFGAGVWVSVRGATIERSENGTTWTSVNVGGSSLEDVAFGYAP